jgi:hypothetical protein
VILDGKNRSVVVMGRGDGDGVDSVIGSMLSFASI